MDELQSPARENVDIETIEDLEAQMHEFHIPEIEAPVENDGKVEPVAHEVWGPNSKTKWDNKYKRLAGFAWKNSRL